LDLLDWWLLWQSFNLFGDCGLLLGLNDFLGFLLDLLGGWCVSKGFDGLGRSFFLNSFGYFLLGGSFGSRLLRSDCFNRCFDLGCWWWNDWLWLFNRSRVSASS
jgi:hypothetical protein